MKDFKELINIADVYGTETKGLAEKREAEIQKHLDEGIWDDLVGGISGLAKKLGIDPATADKVANAISTQPEAKAEIENQEAVARAAEIAAAKDLSEAAMGKG